MEVLLSLIVLISMVSIPVFLVLFLVSVVQKNATPLGFLRVILSLVVFFVLWEVYDNVTFTGKLETLLHIMVLALGALTVVCFMSFVKSVKQYGDKRQALLRLGLSLAVFLVMWAVYDIVTDWYIVDEVVMRLFVWVGAAAMLVSLVLFVRTMRKDGNKRQAALRLGVSSAVFLVLFAVYFPTSDLAAPKAKSTEL
jgi:hypothetical protein